MGLAVLPAVIVVALQQQPWETPRGEVSLKTSSSSYILYYYYLGAAVLTYATAVLEVTGSVPGSDHMYIL